MLLERTIRESSSTRSGRAAKPRVAEARKGQARPIQFSAMFFDGTGQAFAQRRQQRQLSAFRPRRLRNQLQILEREAQRKSSRVEAALRHQPAVGLIYRRRENRAGENFQQ